MLPELVDSFLLIGQPIPLLYMLMGVVVGIVAGAIPGITGGMSIALALPLTYGMDSHLAIVLLVSMYVGVVSGGLITATLLRIPGTPASLMTTMDGYPMAMQGKAARAIGMGISASFFGGIVSWMFLVMLSPPLSRFALRFDHFEYFAMVLMALVFISTLSEGAVFKALLSGFLGMLFAMPGIDPSSAHERIAFGITDLADGFDLLAVLIGIFGMSQLIHDIIHVEIKINLLKISGNSIFMSLRDLKAQAVNLVRSSLIGTWVGMLPGIGAGIASIVAYSTAKTASKTPEKFGTGFDDGIVASEAANNASIGGALIPLITLGIPGSVVDVILLAALVLHDVTPGPMLFRTNPEIAYGVMTSMFVANITMVAIMAMSTRFIAKIINIKKIYLIPSILLFCMVGSFAINNRAFDVWVMIGFGVVGYVIQRLKYPLGPFAIGFILAPIAETSLRSGLMASNGSYMPLVERPFCLAMMIISVLTFVLPFVRTHRGKKSGAKQGG